MHVMDNLYGHQMDQVYVSFDLRNKGKFTTTEYEPPEEITSLNVG